MIYNVNGGTPKWMVYNGKSDCGLGDLGVPNLLGNLYILYELRF